MRNLSAIMALIIVGSAGAPAFAQTAQIAPAANGLTPAPDVLSAEALESESAQGVDNSVLSEQQLNATTSGNSVIAATMTTGDVAFSTSALSGFAGVGNFVINTGNNSNLQGTISVNIVTSTPPL
jgi:hypothetical protein